MIRLADVVETVIDDRRDVLAVRAVRLLFDERGDGQDLVERIAGGLDLLHELIAHLCIKVVEQSRQRVRRVLVHEEFVGIGEEIALKARQVALFIVVDERIVEVRVHRRVGELFRRVDTILVHQRDDLADIIALGDRNFNGIRRERRVLVAHAVDERVVVHVAVDGVGADADAAFRVAEPAERLEEPLVLNEPLVVELRGDGVQVVVARDLDGRLDRCLVERAHVVRQQPAHTGEDRRRDEHEREPQRKAAALPFLLQFLPLGAAARGAVLRALLRFADALGVPAGGLIVVVLVAHSSSLLI